jgi:hypothetical protein
MKKIGVLLAALLICCSATSAPPTNPGKSVKNLDEPSYVTGSFNFYNADRDPTSNEPVIIAGLLDPSQILFWKNTTNGNLWILVSATSDSPAVLSWAKISYSFTR